MHRVLAISDLHLGGDAPAMLGHPEALCGFLESIAAHPNKKDETIELVIHGDFVDFLAESPWNEWTVDQQEAVAKLDQIFGREPQLVAALSRCIQRVDRFTLLLGNHDVELALPRVRDAMYRHLETDSHHCNFLFNNEAYRRGQLLIEHGNRYDSWNRIDHDGLRQTVSALSRGEIPENDWLVACPGSKLVVSAMNPLKAQYRFIDLLKPEDKLLAILLPQIAPSTRPILPHLFRFAQLNGARFIERVLPRRGGRQFIAGQEDSPTAHLPREIAAAERDELTRISAESQLIHPQSPFPAVAVGPEHSELVATGPLGGDALRKLQRKLRHKLCNDTTFKDDDKGEPGTAVRACYDAAEKIIHRDAARVVIMGHTHLRRSVCINDGYYLNTGTWADLIRIDEASLVDSEEGLAALNRWWGLLVADDPRVRFNEPTFADVRLRDDGSIIQDDRPLLRRFEGRGLDEY